MKRPKPKPPADAKTPRVVQEQIQEPAPPYGWPDPPSESPGITVTFTGDPRGGADPANPEYGGKSFPKGESVVVEDETWIKLHGAKLRRNNHFKVE